MFHISIFSAVVVDGLDDVGLNHQLSAVALLQGVGICLSKFWGVRKLSEIFLPDNVCSEIQTLKLRTPIGANFFRQNVNFLALMTFSVGNLVPCVEKLQLSAPFTFYPITPLIMSIVVMKCVLFEGIIKKEMNLNDSW